MGVWFWNHCFAMHSLRTFVLDFVLFRVRNLRKIFGQYILLLRTPSNLAWNITTNIWLIVFCTNSSGPWRWRILTVIWSALSTDLSESPPECLICNGNFVRKPLNSMISNVQETATTPWSEPPNKDSCLEPPRSLLHGASMSLETPPSFSFSSTMRLTVLALSWIS